MFVVFDYNNLICAFTDEDDARLYADAYGYGVGQVEVNPVIHERIRSGQKLWGVHCWNTVEKRETVASVGSVSPVGRVSESSGHLFTSVWAASSEEAIKEGDRMFDEWKRENPT